MNIGHCYTHNTISTYNVAYDNTTREDILCCLRVKYNAIHARKNITTKPTDMHLDLSWIYEEVRNEHIQQL